MIFSEFQEKQLSRLGFGAMRLPVKSDGTVDESLTEKMVAYAMDHGVNYFDTAWPYHNGESEYVMGRILSKYDRGSFYLADKFPGHQHSDSGVGHTQGEDQHGQRADGGYTAGKSVQAVDEVDGIGDGHDPQNADGHAQPAQVPNGVVAENVGV